MRNTLILFLFFSKISIIIAQEISAKPIALNITSNIKNDSLKVVAIYNWIFENVDYDWETYKKLKNGQPYSDEAWKVKDILRTKKAVCGGYAELFNDLCYFNNIKSKYILGESNLEGHAWNAVYINQKWYLMDITWADNIEEKPIANSLQLQHHAQDTFLINLISKEMKELLHKPPTKQEENLLEFIETFPLSQAEKDSINQESKESMRYSQTSRSYLWDDGSYFILEHLPDDPIWFLTDSLINIDCINDPKCVSSFNFKSNFGKNVDLEEKQDSIVQVYQRIQRSYLFNPNNLSVISEAAYFYMERGDFCYKQYYNSISANSDIKNPHELSQLLKKAIKYFELSNSFLQKLENKKEYEDFYSFDISYINAIIAHIKAEKYFKK